MQTDRTTFETLIGRAEGNHKDARAASRARRLEEIAGEDAGLVAEICVAPDDGRLVVKFRDSATQKVVAEFLPLTLARHTYPPGRGYRSGPEWVAAEQAAKNLLRAIGLGCTL